MRSNYVMNRDWDTLIKEYYSSGLTSRQWCNDNGIPHSSFFYQLNLKRTKASVQGETLPAPKQSTEQHEIVKLKFSEEEPSKTATVHPDVASSSSIALSIDLNGIKINIHTGADRQTISNTLSALKVLC